MHPECGPICAWSSKHACQKQGDAPLKRMLLRHLHWSSLLSLNVQVVQSTTVCAALLLCSNAVISTQSCHSKISVTWCPDKTDLSQVCTNALANWFHSGAWDCYSVIPLAFSAQILFSTDLMLQLRRMTRCFDMSQTCVQAAIVQAVMAPVPLKMTVRSGMVLYSHQCH